MIGSASQPYQAESSRRGDTTPIEVLYDNECTTQVCEHEFNWALSNVCGNEWTPLLVTIDDPKKDNDTDGVANVMDVCPETAKGETVYQSGAYSGCGVESKEQPTYLIFE